MKNALMADRPVTDITSVMIVGRVLRMFVVATLLTTALGAATAPARIACLDQGEVWVLSPAGRGEPQQQTRTGAKVEDFRCESGLHGYSNSDRRVTGTSGFVRFTFHI